MQHRALFLSAVTTVMVAAVLAAYCYASESFGFRDFLFLRFEGSGKIFLSKGYQFLELYTLIVSVLALCLSLAVCRRHPIFAVSGVLVAGSLLTWAVLLPRY